MDERAFPCKRKKKHVFPFNLFPFLRPIKKPHQNSRKLRILFPSYCLVFVIRFHMISFENVSQISWYQLSRELDPMSRKNCRLVLWVGENSTSEEESLESYSRIPQSDLQTAFLSLAAQTLATLTRKGWGNIRNEKNWEMGGGRESRIRMTGKVQTFVQRAVTDGEKAIATTVRACVFGLSYCRAARVYYAVHCGRRQRQFLALLHTHARTKPTATTEIQFLKPSLRAKQAIEEELWVKNG